MQIDRRQPEQGERHCYHNADQCKPRPDRVHVNALETQHPLSSYGLTAHSISVT
ncbi:hypothetical protein GFS60_08000 (plasmid) [Rhodococcus sp. WAY2]|nr:hypothetical protein GFS60_08000 [Rhodococcus sp. WAY2]